MLLSAAPATITGVRTTPAGTPDRAPVTFQLQVSNVTQDSGRIVSPTLVTVYPDFNGAFSTNLIAGVYKVASPTLPLTFQITMPSTNGSFDWLSLTTNVVTLLYSNVPLSFVYNYYLNSSTMLGTNYFVTITGGNVTTNIAGTNVTYLLNIPMLDLSPLTAYAVGVSNNVNAAISYTTGVSNNTSSILTFATGVSNNVNSSILYTTGVSNLIGGFVSADFVLTYSTGISNQLVTTSNLLQSYSFGVSNNVVAVQTYAIGASNQLMTTSNLLQNFSTGTSNNVIIVSNQLMTTSNLLQNYSLSLSNNQTTLSNSIVGSINTVSNNIVAVQTYATGVSNLVESTSNTLANASGGATAVQTYATGVSNNVVAVQTYATGVSNLVLTTSNTASNAVLAYATGVSNNVVATSNANYALITATLLTNRIYYTNVVCLTNPATKTVNMTLGQCDFQTNAAFTFTGLTGKSLTNYQSVVITVYNSTGTAIAITAPPNCYTNGVLPYNCTNISKVLIEYHPLYNYTNMLVNPLF